MTDRSRYSRTMRVLPICAALALAALLRLVAPGPPRPTTRAVVPGRRSDLLHHHRKARPRRHRHQAGRLRARLRQRARRIRDPRGLDRPGRRQRRLRSLLREDQRRRQTGLLLDLRAAGLDRHRLKRDVYVRDLDSRHDRARQQGRPLLRAVCGNGAVDADFAGATGDGETVFFVTSESLAARRPGQLLRRLRARPRGRNHETRLGRRELLRAAAATAPSPPPSGRVRERDGGLLHHPRAALDRRRRLQRRHLRARPGGGHDGPRLRGRLVLPARVRQQRRGADLPRQLRGRLSRLLRQRRGLAAGDVDTATDVYARDLPSGPTVLVSAGDRAPNVDRRLRRGAPPTARPSFFTTDREPDRRRRPTTPTDVYRWTGGSPALVTSGTCTQGSGCGSSFNSATADGSSVLFTTTEKLGRRRHRHQRRHLRGAAPGWAPTLVSAGEGACLPACGNGSEPAILNAATADAEQGLLHHCRSGSPRRTTDAGADIYLRDLGTASTSLASPSGVCPHPGGLQRGLLGRLRRRRPRRLPDRRAPHRRGRRLRARHLRALERRNAHRLGRQRRHDRAGDPGPDRHRSRLARGIAHPVDPGPGATREPRSSSTPAPTARASRSPPAPPPNSARAGLAVTVAAGSTTSFRATATDVNGDTSACSLAVTYTQATPEATASASAAASEPPPPSGGGSSGGGKTGSGTRTGGGGKAAAERVDHLRRAADPDHLRPRLEDPQAAAGLPLRRRDRTAGHRLLLQGRPAALARLRLAAEAAAR